MSFEIAISVIAAVFVAATAVGVICRRSQLRVRTPEASNATVVSPADFGLPADTRFGDAATLIQFSTQFCSKCPGTARLLRAETEDLSGVTHIEIDLTDQIDVARAFNVLQTPTTLVLDPDGRIRSRITGAPTAAVVRDELHKIDALPFTIERTEVAS